MALRSSKNTYEISSQIVRYFDRVYGFLSLPQKEGKFPAVLVVHGDWGLDEYIKEKCEELSRFGYIVLAIDLFGGQVTKDLQRSRKLIEKVKFQESRINILAALAFLQEEYALGKIGILGFSFGVDHIINADVLDEINGLVNFHNKVDLLKVETIKCPTLFIYGEAEDSSSLEYINELKKNLLKLDIENEIYLYLGANRDFDNSGSAHFSPKESEDAWEKVIAFLKRNLQSYKKVKIKVKSK